MTYSGGLFDVDKVHKAKIVLFRWFIGLIRRKDPQSHPICMPMCIEEITESPLYWSQRRMPTDDASYECEGITSDQIEHHSLDNLSVATNVEDKTSFLSFAECNIIVVIYNHNYARTSA